MPPEYFPILINATNNSKTSPTSHSLCIVVRHNIFFFCLSDIVRQSCADLIFLAVMYPDHHSFITVVAALLEFPKGRIPTEWSSHHV